MSARKTKYEYFDDAESLLFEDDYSEVNSTDVCDEGSPQEINSDIRYLNFSYLFNDTGDGAERSMKLSGNKYCVEQCVNDPNGCSRKQPTKFDISESKISGTKFYGLDLPYVQEPHTNPENDSPSTLPSKHWNAGSIFFAKRSILAPEKHASMILVHEKIEFPVVVLFNESGLIKAVPIICEALGQDWDCLIDRHVFDNILQEIKEVFKLQDFLKHYFSHAIKDDSELFRMVQQDCMNVLESTLLPKLSKTNSSRIQYSTVVLDQVFEELNVPFGQPAVLKDVFCSWLGKNSMDAHSQSPDPITGDDNCLICFDSIPAQTSISNLTSCGHALCTTCWKEYIDVNVKSGSNGLIRCPGENCKVSLDLFDALHIIFTPNACTIDDTERLEETLDKLISNTLELDCVTRKSSSYCPSTDCNRLITHTKSHLGPGWNIMQCTCGEMFCAECPQACDRRIHPGISCADYRMMESDSASMVWLLKNTRPCPKCKVPIDRFAGCNHVRCAKCQNYFCWKCGGVGQDCNAYSCLQKADDMARNRALSTYGMFNQKASFSDNFLKASYEVQAIDTKIKQIHNGMTETSHIQSKVEDLRLEREIRLTLCWSMSYLFSVKDKTHRVSMIETAIKRMIDVCNMLETRKDYRFRPKFIPPPNYKLNNIFDKDGKELEFNDIINDAKVIDVVKTAVKSSLNILMNAPVKHPTPIVVTHHILRDSKNSSGHETTRLNNDRMRKREPWRTKSTLLNRDDLAEERLIKKASRFRKGKRDKTTRS